MRPTVRRLRDDLAGPAGVIRGMVRRMRLAASSAVRWTVEGFVDHDGKVESDEAEVFPGVGVFARPLASDTTEVILLKVGGASGHAVIVATRNQDGIKRIGALAPDETIIFNSTIAVKLTADGAIQIGSVGGPYTPLVNGVVLASGVDPFTGATYGALANASTKVMAEK